MKSILLFTALFMSSFAFANPVQVTKITPQNVYVHHYFGQVPVNSISVARYEIHNPGPEPLFYQGTVVYGLDFSAIHNCQNGVAPQSSCLVELRFWPAFVGFQQGEIDVRFANGNDIRFDVSGEAFQY